MSRFTVMVALMAFLAGSCPGAEPARIGFSNDTDKGEFAATVDGKPALVYLYGKEVDLPHFFPLNSPSGKPLTVQQIEPYPHHRSFWFADTVQLAGARKASFYNALYSRADKNDPKSPFKDRIRQVSFGEPKIAGDTGEITMKLLWEMDQKTPVLDEERRMRVRALGEGEYFIDIAFTVTATYGDVAFQSDAAHYAWPYVRMNPAFSVDKGGKMVNSEGGVNQAQTHEKPARWIDYVNTIDGATEGLAFFSHPDNEHPHTWLTRDYGTFGPRRAAPRHGKPFTLKKGESLKQRIGLLIHRGDVTAGKVAERYRMYGEGAM